MALALDVRDLAIEGDDGRAILRVAAMQAAPGQAVVVRGASGAGKSTLLLALAGLQLRATGAVRWGDTDMLTLGEGARAAFRARHVGMVFQDYLLFEELGARANAGIAAQFAPAEARARIQADAAALLNRLGVPDHAGRTVASFSGGERQRIAVARALAGGRDVILADEPTASLDRAAADRLIADLVALAREEGRTLIAASHDARLHAAADIVLDIADGRIAGTRRAA